MQSSTSSSYLAFLLTSVVQSGVLQKRRHRSECGREFDAPAISSLATTYCGNEPCSVVTREHRRICSEDLRHCNAPAIERQNTLRTKRQVVWSAIEFLREIESKPNEARPVRPTGPQTRTGLLTHANSPTLIANALLVGFFRSHFANSAISFGRSSVSQSPYSMPMNSTSLVGFGSAGT